MSLFRSQRRAMGRWIIRGARSMRNGILGETPLDVMEKPGRILIIRPYFLGDILLCLPVVQALKQRWPGAKISWLLRKEWRELLPGHSAVDEIIPFSQEKMHSFAAPLEFWRVGRELRQRNFDLVLTLAWDRSSAMWAGFSGAKVRLGIEEYGRPRFSSLFHTSTVVAPERSADRRHMADFYNEPMRLLGFPLRSENYKVFPTSEEEKRVEERLKSLFGTQGLGVDHRGASVFSLQPSAFLLVHPGGRLGNKRWPIEKFAELVCQLSQKISYGIILICGPGEESLLSPSAFSLQSSVLTWPSPTLGELMALAQKAALFIGNDSGAAHLAAASGCRVISIFGADPTRWRPLGEENQVVSAKGLENVTVEEVLKAVLAILKI